MKWLMRLLMNYVMGGKDDWVEIVVVIDWGNKELELIERVDRINRTSW